MVDLVVLKGGNSLEKDIAIKTFQNVIKNLDSLKYNISIIEMNCFDPINFINTLKSLEFKNTRSHNYPIVALNLLHGGAGEDGTIQGFLDMLNIKYIGSNALSSGICMDKNLTKTILKANNIPVVEQILLDFNNFISLNIADIEQLGYPLIIKPNNGGSSVGIEVINNFKELERVVLNIKDNLNNNNNNNNNNLETCFLVEKFIHGQEATCSIIQKKSDLKVLSILDININNNNNNNNINSFFDYESKFNNSIINTCTIESSKLPIFMQTMIKEIAKKIFVLLKCKDYANIDFIISDDDIYVLEVNTLPGLTENSLLCKALELNDYTLKNFLDDMIHQNIN